MTTKPKPQLKTRCCTDRPTSSVCTDCGRDWLNIATEREACAQVAECAALDWNDGDPRKNIAAAIRARGAK